MTKEQQLRRAHQDCCQAMAQWHRDLSEEWVEEQRKKAAEAHGLKVEELRRWQEGK